MSLFLLLACVIVPDAPSTCGDAATCWDAAILGSDGLPDPCDLEACVTCRDACGEDCATLESYPPQYACGSGSWSVYDVCPDWQLPTGAITAADVIDLGCGAGSGEQIYAAAGDDGRVAVTHFDYGLGCCPDSVQVDVVVTGSTLEVGYRPIDDLCDCACMLDVSYALVDVPSGTWTIESAATGAVTTVVVP